MKGGNGKRMWMESDVKVCEGMSSFWKEKDGGKEEGEEMEKEEEMGGSGCNVYS